MDIFTTYTPLQWMLIILAAFIIGLGKAGLKGIDMLNVTIMAIVFGGKASTGIVLPLLCVADILAVSYYHRHAQWPLFWKVIPWMAVGILVGVYAGKDLNEALFRKAMAVIIIITAIMMVALEFRKQSAYPNNKVDVDINVGKEQQWYSNPIVWVIGGAVFILLLVALLRGGKKA